MSWTSRQGDEVDVGDLVALSVLTSPDARGRIVGTAEDGRPICVLGDFDDPEERHPRLTVEVENVLLLIRRGGVSPMVRHDYDCGCQVLAQAGVRPGASGEAESSSL